MNVVNHKQKMGLILTETERVILMDVLICCAKQLLMEKRLDMRLVLLNVILIVITQFWVIPQNSFFSQKNKKNKNQKIK